MISRVGSTLSRFAKRAVPDPFVLALFLTVVVAAAGALHMHFSNAQPVAASDGVGWTLFVGWFNGFRLTGGLAFALQMCLVLVTGHALALSPPVQRAVLWIAKLPRSAASAALLVAAFACLAGVAHWGLGAIAGALLAREIGRHAPGRNLRVHYPLLGAAAYAGLAIWHGGASGSAPLKVAAKDHFAAHIIGTVPVSDTLLGSLNLVVTGTLLVVIPLLFYVLTPKRAQDCVPANPENLGTVPDRVAEPVDSVPSWLQERAIVGWTVGTLGLSLSVLALITGRLTFDLDLYILLFLFLGVAFQGGLRHYVNAITDGAKGAGAIVLQFPFYFGILGLMKASGLITSVSDKFVQLSDKTSFPVFAFLSAGLVNLFVPSGGGQWSVQGEILLRAGDLLGVPPETTIMAFAYGDAWTNMLQPFWALPLLGIMGLRARDIIGYTAMVFFAMLVIVPVLLLVLG